MGSCCCPTSHLISWIASDPQRLRDFANVWEHYENWQEDSAFLNSAVIALSVLFTNCRDQPTASLYVDRMQALCAKDPSKVVLDSVSTLQSHYFVLVILSLYKRPQFPLPKKALLEYLSRLVVNRVNAGIPWRASDDALYCGQVHGARSFGKLKRKIRGVATPPGAFHSIQRSWSK